MIDDPAILAYLADAEKVLLGAHGGNGDGSSSEEDDEGTPDSDDSSGSDEGSYDLFEPDTAALNGGAMVRMARESFPENLFVFFHPDGPLTAINKAAIDFDNYKVNGQYFRFFTKTECTPQIRLYLQSLADVQSSEEDEGEPPVNPHAINRRYVHDYQGTPPPDDLPAPYSSEYEGIFYYKKIDGAAFLEDGPSPEDVIQGIGNCYFMAALACLSVLPSGKALLRDRVKTLGSDGNVSAWLPVRQTNEGEELFACAGGGKRTGEKIALWPALLEQEFAKIKGGYSAIEGGIAETAFAALGLACETVQVNGWAPDKIRDWFVERRQWALLIGTAKGWGAAEDEFIEAAADQLQSVEIKSVQAFLVCGEDGVVRTSTGERLGAFHDRSGKRPEEYDDHWLDIRRRGRFEFDPRYAAYAPLLKINLEQQGMNIPYIQGDQHCEIDEQACVMHGGQIMCWLVDADGRKLGEAKGGPWHAKRLSFEGVEAASDWFYIRALKNYVYNEKLSTPHQYAVKKVEESGIVLWNTDGGRDVFLTYAEVGKSVKTLSASKL